MKAVMYRQRGLVFMETAAPSPQAGEVLVRIRAASVNALDIRMMKMGLVPKNRIYGADIAGRVAAVGSGVTDWSVGDPVVGELSDCGLGGFAELVAVPERVLVKKPAALSFEQAAALPVAAITAYKALAEIGRLSPGRRVLIAGAGGGVGTYAVQLGKHLGASVAALCGPSNLDSIHSLGADEVYDYGRTELAEIPGVFDLILSVNGAYPLSDFKRKLTSQGILVVIGGPLKHVLKTVAFGPFLSLGFRKIKALAYKTSREDLATILALAAAGKIRPIIERSFPLEKTAEAVAHLAAGHCAGKIVVVMPE